MQFEKNFSLRRIEFFEILINRGVETFASRNTRFRLCYAPFLVYPKRKGKKKKKTSTFVKIFQTLMNTNTG